MTLQRKTLQRKTLQRKARQRKILQQPFRPTDRGCRGRISARRGIYRRRSAMLPT